MGRGRVASAIAQKEENMAKRIYINPGHSNVDPGAVGYETERKLNVKAADYMNAYLRQTYEDVETKVTKSSVNSTTVVCQEANKWKADLLVSIHFNAGGGDGYEALVYSEKRKDLGKIFEKHVKAAGQNSRGVKLRPDLNVLRSSNMPAILNEGAFVDNKKDIADWNEDAELRKLGIAYAEAAAEYLKLSKKELKPEPVEPEKSDVLYRVQVGAYREVENARAMEKKLDAAGFPAVIVPGDQ